MNPSSLLWSETGALLLASLLIALGSVELIRRAASLVRARRQQAAATLPAWRWPAPRQLVALGAVGAVAGVLLAFEYPGPGSPADVVRLFASAYAAVAGLSLLERVLLTPHAGPSTGEALPTETRVPAAGGAVRALGGGLALLLLLWGFADFSNPPFQLLGLSAGAALSGVVVRASGGRRGGEPTPASSPEGARGHAVESILWPLSGMVAALLIGYYGPEARIVLPGALLLPALCFGLALFGSTITRLAMGRPAAGASRADRLARLAISAIVSGFLLYVLDWALEVGVWWVLMAQLLAVGAGTVVWGLVTRVAAPPEASGRPGESSSRDPVSEESRARGRFHVAAWTGSAVTVAAIGAVYLLASAQGRWQSSFVPDLGMYGIALFGVTWLGQLPGSTEAAPNDASVATSAGLTRFLSEEAARLAGYGVTVALAFTALLMALPAGHQSAPATLWSQLVPGNPAVIAGGAVGAAVAAGLGSLGALYFSHPVRSRGTIARVVVPATLSTIGVLAAGLVIGPAAAIGCVAALALFGVGAQLSGIQLVRGDRAEDSRETPIGGSRPLWDSPSPELCADLLLAATVAMLLSRLFYAHGLLPGP